ncbi:p21-C-terminal region-binding protein-domain-containing protein [Morchella snyderi]|nr:p21-C-terminal region-binding protein-domain-containing protein [Morchella snyderi]
MPKRKDLQPAPEDTPMAGSDEDSDTESLDIVNVDFEMFDPQPAHDFHGLKTLLRQLLDADNTLFDISALAELILSQPLLGTTVKVDGNESDPYAFLTVLNMQEHHDKPIIQQLRTYLLSRAPAALQPQLQTLLAPDAPTHTGLILAERLLNVPTEIVPPMYRMLLEEISWAVADNEPYRFGHFLLLSKTYTEVVSRLDDASNDGPRAAKKGRRTMGAGGKKKKGGAAGGEVFYFHPEDETIMRRAKAAGGYAYVKEADEGAADSKRAFGEFGIVPRGHMMLVECAALEGVVGDLEGLFRP